MSLFLHNHLCIRLDKAVWNHVRWFWFCYKHYRRTTHW